MLFALHQICLGGSLSALHSSQNGNRGVAEISVLWGIFRLFVASVPGYYLYIVRARAKGCVYVFLSNNTLHSIR